MRRPRRSSHPARALRLDRNTVAGSANSGHDIYTVGVAESAALVTVHTATTPIDRRHVRLLWHFYLPEAMVGVADEIIEGVTGPHGLLADVPIWRDKVFRERPLLVKGDGPITEFRRWYDQFYAGR